MNSKLLSLFLTVFVLSSCGSGSSSIDQAIQEGKALVRVGSEKIHEGYLKLLEKMNPGIKTQLENPMGKKRVIDNLVEQELLYQESLNRGLDKDPVVKQKADLYRRVVVAQSLLDNETEKKAKEYYDQNKDKEFERVKGVQLFFSNSPKPTSPPGKVPPPPTEEEKKKADELAQSKVNAAYERLKKGEEWEKVLKENGATEGLSGDMGYLTKADRRIERLDYQKLIDLAFSLKKGEFSEPIRAKDGWHIIKVVEDKQAQPYEEVAMTIKFKIRGEVKSNLMAELKQKHKVEYLDVSLAESPPSMPPVPSSLNAPAPALEQKATAEKK